MNLLACLSVGLLLCASRADGHGSESSGFVEVRPGANMFWWLMRAGQAGGDDYKNYPLVIWLQGGPGASSTGFGNFAEIGPHYVNGSVRGNTWLKYANLCSLTIQLVPATPTSRIKEPSLATTAKSPKTW